MRGQLLTRARLAGTDRAFTASPAGTEARASTATVLDMLLKIFDIAPATRAVIASAASSGLDDFEDAVLHEFAVAAGVDDIVTRHQTDYEKSTVAIYSPQELEAVLKR